MTSFDYQKLCLSIVQIKDYCRNSSCSENSCVFFRGAGLGCMLTSGKSPSKWSVPDTIIKGMDCIEINPVIEVEQNDKSIFKEGDWNGASQ